jgi:hypothetical protein|nr:MAG TPA: hypothetical protein [Caudoviricetes sp.]
MEVLNIVASIVLILASSIMIINGILLTMSLWKLYQRDHLRYKISKLEFKINKIIENELKNIKVKEEKENEN